MKKLIVFAICILAFSNVYAADKKEALAVEMLELSYVKEAVNKTIEMYSTQLMSVYPGITEIELMTYFQMSMGWEKSKPSMIQVTIDLYSEKELEEIVTFLKSPVGRVYSKQSIQFSEKFSQILLADLQRSIQNLNAQLEAASQPGS